MQNENLRQSQIDLNEANSKTEYNRDRFFQLFNMSPVSYLTLDARGIIRDCNQAFIDLIARQEQKLLGRTLIEFVDPSNRAMFEIRFKNMLHDSQKCNFEFFLIGNAGHSPYVSLSAQVLSNEASKTEILITLTDISELKSSEIALKE